MPINNLTQEELDGLDLTISNGAVISASITTPDPLPTEINMVNLGDSNTEASTVWFPHANRYSDLFGSSNETVTTINKGLTSLATSDIIADLSNTLYPNKDITKRNIATVLVGTNDFAYGKSISTVWNDYQTLITNIKNDGWELVIFTYPIKLGDTTRNNLIRELNTLIRDNAINLGYEVADIHSDFVSDTDIDQNKDGYMIADGLHFSELGHNIIFNNLNTMFKLGIIDYPTGVSNGLLNNLISYYEFENDVLDSHGSNDGTNNGTTDIAGKVNRGRNFDGTNDDINIGDPTALRLTGNYSFALWVNFDALPGTMRMMTKEIGTSGGHSLFYAGASTNITHEHNDGSSFNSFNTGFSPSTGTWYHLGMSFDGSNRRFYKDGALFATQATTTNIAGTTDNLVLGGLTSGGNYVDGIMDETGFWDRALSDDDFAALYNSGSGLAYSNFTT